MTPKFHDREYLRLAGYVLEKGVQKGDRTGTGTISTFAQQMRFDLSGGSIPLLTTKKMHTKSIIHELLWFLAGDTNIKYLNDNGVRIWNEWADENGELGPMYGGMWRSFPPPNYYMPVKRRSVSDDTKIKTWNSSATPSNNYTNGKFNGNHFTNHQGLDYVVLGVDGKISNGKDINKQVNTYAVKFTKTNWVKHKVSTRQVSKGNFSDQSLPSLYGVGILGDYQKKKESTLNKQLRRTWENMISRCYNSNDVAYHNYGGRGVIVCERWKVLSDFLTDIATLPNWLVRKKDSSYVLDKDYYGDNRIYHPEACVWITKIHNNQYQRRSIPIILSNKGNMLYFPSAKSAGRYVGRSETSILRRLRNQLNTPINGYVVSKFTNPNYIIRFPTNVDQICTVIDQLRHNPDDRRIVVSAWHPALVPISNTTPNENVSLGYQCLPPCHAFFQFWSHELSLEARTSWFSDNVHGTTREDTESDEEIHAYYDKYNVPRRALSCHLYQRSCDVGLGVPFNVAQYSILTHMIAQVTNHVAAEFVWTGGDAHIYNNHVDHLDGQLQLTPFASPTLLLNSEVKEIEDFTFDDFKVIDYVSHPTIKMSVSV